jgi:5-methylcytosine-specific restriction protein A
LLFVPRFYDKQIWRRLRRRILERDRYRCVRCKAYVGGKGDARVDHIKPISVAPHLALDPSNLRTLCATCDNRSHSEKSSRDKSVRVDRIVHGFDADGVPRDAAHPWFRL